MYSKTNFMRASLVFITTLVSFFSLLGVVIGAKPFGFNPSNFHNPEMVFDPLTFVATVLILVVPIVLTLFSQKFLLGEKLTNFFEGPVFPPMFFGLVFGIALKILATSAVFILSPGSSASLLVIPVGILSYLPYFAFFIFTLFLNSLSEELVYRAFPLQALWRNDLRFLIGLGFVTAILFSLAHFLIEEPSLIRFVYRTSFGFLASLLFIQSRSLWKIVGLHTGWNFVALAAGDSEWRTGAILHLIGLRDGFEGVANSIVLILASIALLIFSLRTKRFTSEIIL